MKYKKGSNSVQEIEYLIRARYPLLYVISSEEYRVENSLYSISVKRNKKIFYWSITDGLIISETNKNGELRDPLKILDYINEFDEASSIFILRDFHPYLEDAMIIRKLRDLSKSLKTQKVNKNIIILSPIFKLPPDLEKEVVIIDYQLPDKEQIDDILSRVIKLVEKPSELEIVKSPLLREKTVEAALGLTSDEAENVFARSLVQTNQLDIDIILSEKEQIIRKSGILEFYKTNEEIDGIGGLDALKVWLRKRGQAFGQEARDFSLPLPKGALLIGIPGCGKSLTAKAVSNLWSLPLLRLDVGKIFSSLVGSSEENVRKAIKTAESIAPCILWLDELEKGFSGVSSSGNSDSGTTSRVFGTFITWLQEKESSVFCVATANNVSMLPPELLRKGRFDEIFFVDLPGREEREQIFRIHLNKKKRKAENFDIKEFAERTDGFSGSEIEQVVISALFDAFDDKKEINNDYIFNSIREIVPLSLTMEEEIKRIRDWSSTRARRASTPDAVESKGDNIRGKLELE